MMFLQETAVCRSLGWETFQMTVIIKLTCNLSMVYYQNRGTDQFWNKIICGFFRLTDYSKEDSLGCEEREGKLVCSVRGRVWRMNIFDKMDDVHGWEEHWETLSGGWGGEGWAWFWRRVSLVRSVDNGRVHGENTSERFQTFFSKVSFLTQYFYFFNEFFFSYMPDVALCVYYRFRAIILPFNASIVIFSREKRIMVNFVIFVYILKNKFFLFMHTCPSATASFRVFPFGMFLIGTKFVFLLKIAVLSYGLHHVAVDNQRKWKVECINELTERHQLCLLRLYGF